MFLKKLKIGQKLFYGFGIITVMMLGVLAYTYANFIKESEAIDLNIESYTVIREADQMLINIINMETGSRGFALTGKDEFLEPFNKGQTEYQRQVNLMKSITSSNYKHQERLNRIQNEFEAWITYQTEKIINARREINNGKLEMDDIVFEAQKGIAKQHMDNIRSILNEITRDEELVLEARKNTLSRMENQTLYIISIGGSISAVLAIIIAFLVIRMIVDPVKTVTNTFKEIADGDVNLEVRLNVNSKDELGAMSQYFNKFMTKLKEMINESRNQNWLKNGQAELSEKIRGDLDIASLSSNIVTYIAKYIDAQIGAFYIKDSEDVLRMVGNYAYKRRKNFVNEIKIGEGIVGQAALEKQCMVISNLPEDYISIGTGIGEAAPRNLLVCPCVSNNEVVCVIELGSFHKFTNEQLQFVELVSESIGVTLNSVKSQIKMKELLNKTLEQSEELQAQQEELKQSNEELEEQARALKESEAAMQSQQEELRVINEELAERSRSLELQSAEIKANNERLMGAQVEIENKAAALESANKYKSEFLANMSHELRTPLNSIIVLSQMLTKANGSTALSDKQRQYAETINSSGEDLLKLINDILDLSKVEAGKLDINLEEVNIRELVGYTQHSFGAVAEQKGLSFNIEIESNVPISIESDSQRVLQIVNNLLSNALKFTHKGGVTLEVKRIENVKNSTDFHAAKSWISIAIKDTGIGIMEDKQDVIFEAFKQSDGTTSRKYGGTGLGLSISRELARLLGGNIKVESSLGTGSTFTLILPERQGDKKESSSLETIKSTADTVTNIVTEVINPKDIIKKNDTNKAIEKTKQLLIIEDDKNFSNLLVELAEEKGFRPIVAENGVQGIQFACQNKPDAVLLDIGLPDIDGWKVVERLKELKETKDIPIHIISGKEEQSTSDKVKGILGYLKKPVTLESIDDIFKKIEARVLGQLKKLLIVDHNNTKNITEILKGKDIQITHLLNGVQAINLLGQEKFDCMVLEYNLNDMPGMDFLEKLEEDGLSNLPIIIYTEKELTREEEENLQKYTESIIIKGNKALDRLLAEASIFLHNVDSKIGKDATKTIKADMERENSFKDKTVLLVDDDMRNVFALSSILEEKGLKVIIGRNGNEAIQKLNENKKIDIVLMDIMMPEMDGYSAMKEIRKEAKFSKLPIIALTAKAMKEDRVKCIEAGADDYLTKPIDIERLISLLRVWLYK